MTTRLYLHYGDQRLVEPNARSVRAMWAELGEYLRLHYSAGVYRDKTQVNAILQSAFKFLKRKLDHLVRRFASREFMEFVLHQYNLTAEKWAGLPSNHNIENMRQHSESAVRRRALKYLAECTAMRSPPEFAPLHFSNLFAETEQAILCTEMMVNLYQISDRTYCLFPDHTQLTLFPSKEEEPVPIQILPLPSYKTLDIDLNRRIAKETEGRKKWFPDPTFDRDVERQGDTLNTSFKEAWGLTYQDFCSVLTGVIENAIHAPGSYPITFYHYSDRSPKSAERTPRSVELIAENGFGGGAWLAASDRARGKTSNIRIERPTRSVECGSFFVGWRFVFAWFCSRA